MPTTPPPFLHSSFNLEIRKRWRKEPLRTPWKREPSRQKNHMKHKELQIDVTVPETVMDAIDKIHELNLMLVIKLIYEWQGE